MVVDKERSSGMQRVVVNNQGGSRHCLGHHNTFVSTIHTATSPESVVSRWLTDFFTLYPLSALSSSRRRPDHGRIVEKGPGKTAGLRASQVDAFVKSLQRLPNHVHNHCSLVHCSSPLQPSFVVRQNISQIPPTWRSKKEGRLMEDYWLLVNTDCTLEQSHLHFIPCAPLPVLQTISSFPSLQFSAYNFVIVFHLPPGAFSASRCTRKWISRNYILQRLLLPFSTFHVLLLPSQFIITSRYVYPSSPVCFCLFQRTRS